MIPTHIKTLSIPAVNFKEALRYAGTSPADTASAELLSSLLPEAEKRLSYRVCYFELPLKIKGTLCDFKYFKTESEDLAKNLKDADGAVVFATTVGSSFERLIAKYSKISPAKAVLLDGLGSERIEAVCDMFCEELKDIYQKTFPRFSPGYGDLPLEAGREIINLLDAPKIIGLSLTDSLLMTPSKSVTAIVGIKYSRS